MPILFWIHSAHYRGSPIWHPDRAWMLMGKAHLPFTKLHCVITPSPSQMLLSFLVLIIEDCLSQPARAQWMYVTSAQFMAKALPCALAWIWMDVMTWIAYSLLFGLDAWRMAVTRLCCRSLRCLRRSRRFTCKGSPVWFHHLSCGGLSILSPVW